MTSAITILCWYCKKEGRLAKFIRRADGQLWCDECHYEWVGEHFERKLPLDRSSILKSQEEHANKKKKQRASKYSKKCS